jgi:Flp pilus assembly CpaF family ATPase
MRSSALRTVMATMAALIAGCSPLRKHLQRTWVDARLPDGSRVHARFLSQARGEGISAALADHSMQPPGVGDSL